jgi:hypothetical protein
VTELLSEHCFNLAAAISRLLEHIYCLAECPSHQSNTYNSGWLCLILLKFVLVSDYGLANVC